MSSASAQATETAHVVAAARVASAAGAAVTAAETAACIAPGGSSAEAVDNNLGHVLVSVASESTGKAQTCRNELFALFGIWVGWADKSLSKKAWEEQDKALRSEARKLYVGELLKSGVIVAYQRFANGTQSVTVSWDGVKMEREVKDDGRSAARNSFVALLRKRVESQITHVTTWPLLDRPQTDPRNGVGALPLAKADRTDVDYAALQAQMMFAHSSGVYRPAPCSALAPAKPKSSVAGDRAPAGVASVGRVKQTQPPAGGGASAYAASSASSTMAHVPQVLKEILERGGGAGGAMDDAQMQDEGPGSVALLFATEADVRNGAVWEQWLLGAPPKSYTIYVHAQHPDRVVTPLFKDSLVSEHAFVSTAPWDGEPAVRGTGVGTDPSLTSKSSALMQHCGGDGESGDAGAQKRSNGTAATSMDSIMFLLKEALKEPSNKWFMVLDDACLPMVGFGTFFTRMALHPTKSIFDFHPERVQTAMLSILKFVTEVPALVRDAIENNDLVAHSPIGTMLVRRDAQTLANASSAVLREWESALSSGPMQDVLFPPHGAQYFGNWIQQERIEAVPTLPAEDISDVIDDFFSKGGVPPLPGVDEPGAQQLSQGKISVRRVAGSPPRQSLLRSLCLSVDELFLFALLRRLSRLNQGEAQAHKKVARVQHVSCVCVRIGVYVCV